MNLKFDFSNPYKTLFIIWSVAWLILLPWMSRKAGITEDEYQHNIHGKKILAYYERKDSTAGLTPFDSSGKWAYISEGTASKTAINVYGGFFDFLSAFLYQNIFHDMSGEFEFRHVLSSLFGALLLIFTGLIAQRMSGSWGTGMLTLVIVTFTPRLIGNSLSNPKDIPLAALYAFSLLQIVSFLTELPRLRWHRLLLLGLSFSLAMAVRSPAAVLIFYFGFFTACYIIYLYFTGEMSQGQFLKTAGLTVAVAIGGYLCTAFFWPWDQSNPILNPYRALTVFKNFSVFNHYELFEGKWIGNNEIPWYFVPKWLYITLPVSVISGLVLFLIMSPKLLRHGFLKVLLYILIIFSFAVPLLPIIIGKSNIYNGARHILFMWPPIIVIASLGWNEVFKSVKDIYLKMAVSTAFMVILAEPAVLFFATTLYRPCIFHPSSADPKGLSKILKWIIGAIPSSLRWTGLNKMIHSPVANAK